MTPSTIPSAFVAPSPALVEPARLRIADNLLLIAYCLLLFGYSMISGRPLSLHEARLPQTSREMMANHDYLIPRSGGRPWLERPPLPHWITIATSAALGQHSDKVWVVRLPPVLMGTITVLLTAWIAARFFGCRMGLVSGLVLATCYEFYAYASLAEDDIFLAALVAAAIALFVRDSVAPAAGQPASSRSFFGSRPWSVLAFFVILGLSNLAKGPLLGPAAVLSTIGVFLITSRDWLSIRRYTWLWGWLIFIALSAFWPILVYRRFPDVLVNWRIDYAGGTTQYNEPPGTIFARLLGGLLPWTPAALIGLYKTFPAAKRGERAARFLWCWAILPILVLSLPHRKHHHYLVPSLAPWAILAALGAAEIAKTMFRGVLWSRRPLFGMLAFGLPGALALFIFRNKLPGPIIPKYLLIITWLSCVYCFYTGLFRQRASILLTALLGGILMASAWAQSFAPDLTTDDTRFLHQVEAAVPRDALLTINADLRGELDFFRIGFYLRGNARLLHNLTFLRDQNIRQPDVYVVTRAKDKPFLETMGAVTLVRQSAHTRRETSSADRFTLFHLHFRSDLRRFRSPLTSPQ